VHGWRWLYWLHGLHWFWILVEPQFEEDIGSGFTQLRAYVHRTWRAVRLSFAHIQSLGILLLLQVQFVKQRIPFDLLHRLHSRQEFGHLCARLPHLKLASHTLWIPVGPFFWPLWLLNQPRKICPLARILCRSLGNLLLSI
jgi:hypothetical protein